VNRRELLVVGLLLAALLSGLAVSLVNRARLRHRQASSPLAVSSPCAETLNAAARRLNVNLASAAQLEALPGIGPVLAQRIVSLRELRGRFESIAELRDVAGIGPKRFAAIQNLVTVDSAGPAPTRDSS
jgi:competence ComEA-like helix-hairpin-helix protein